MTLAIDGLGLARASGEIAVERALAEVRAGRAVLLEGPGAAALVMAAETFEAVAADALGALGAGDARLVLPAPRLTRLGAAREKSGSVALPRLDASRIAHLALSIDAHIDAPVAPASDFDAAALELLRLALVLPAAVVLTLPAAATEGAVRVRLEDVMAYRATQVAQLRMVGRAPVPLEGAGETEFVVFRGGEGLRDQVAIVVGRPDLSGPVAVRLHSACLTGDLFGSLKCDCGDQLRDTVHRMAEGQGGILLYLDQEGRGNGISNKMRAYALQAQGFDTFDADAALGFGLDQRRFDFAAEMLRQLGVRTVRVFTNNPLKIAALKAGGLDVVADQRVLGRPTAENVRYLASKRDRAGHYIDFDSLAARVPD
ncbi:GTP cyclohydrolase II RibA [Xanthobacter autotrophicus DSM 431]|uniref:GTP cyclohydrolase II RibA n=1 Tax=Xanthobacter nonsaccharivorans TaxID=3119912 RepID=UPI003728309B